MSIFEVKIAPLIVECMLLVECITDASHGHTDEERSARGLHAQEYLAGIAMSLGIPKDRMIDLVRNRQLEALRKKSLKQNKE